MAATARTALSIAVALFWFVVARLFTANRLVLVPLFVACALLSWLAILLVQSGADPKEVE